MNEYCIELVPFILGSWSCAAQLLCRNRVHAPWGNPRPKHIRLFPRTVDRALLGKMWHMDVYYLKHEASP